MTYTFEESVTPFEREELVELVQYLCKVHKGRRCPRGKQQGYRYGIQQPGESWGKGTVVRVYEAEMVQARQASSREVPGSLGAQGKLGKSDAGSRCLELHQKGIRE